MRTISREQADVILDARAEGRAPLPARMLEKDLMIVEAIRAISTVNVQGIALTFSGGTCLAKAHKLLERMSEDIDLRITLEDPDVQTRSSARRYLGDLKDTITTAIRDQQFFLPDGAIRARNDNQFMAFELEYASRYEPDKALRPTLRIELISIPPRLPTTTCSIRPLIDELTNKATAEPVSLECLSVEETYCEKIISYLRRATEYLVGREHAQYDRRLARHVYDVHRIITLRYPRVVELPPVNLFSSILAAETVQYGSRDAAFAIDPVGTLKKTLARVAELDEFRQHYDYFARALIYSAEKLPFADAFETFRTTASILLGKCHVNVDEQIMSAHTAVGA